MTFTHEEILDAVRIAGQDGQVFGAAAVREHLKVSTSNRSELSKFHRRFRTFQDAAPEAIEKVGNNLYRLKSAGSDAVNAETDAPAPVRASEPPVHNMLFAELSQGELSDAIDLGIDEALAPASLPMPPLAPALALAPTPQAAELSAPTMTLDVSGDGVVLAPETGNHQPLGFVELTDPMSTAEETALPTESARFEPIRSYADVQITPPRTPRAPARVTSSIEQAQVLWTRSWRERGQWLGRRVAELFHRA